MILIKIVLGFTYKILKKSYFESLVWFNQKKYPNCRIDPTCKLGDVELVGNIEIGKNTYINSGQIITGSNSTIKIGNWCAIGYDTKIIAITHDTKRPTGLNRKKIEKNIIVGNNVWIGSNVFIKEGISIGDNSIIGANSVVTKNVESNSIVGGVPAKLIRKIN